MRTDALSLLGDVADAVAAALRVQRDWGPSGRRDGQYALDLSADDAALGVLRRAGVGVLSEESGLEDRGTGEVVVVDPVDGSTNCSRGVPWYATSLCLVDADGPAAALVVNLASGVRFWATRGGGAFCDGAPIRASGCTELSRAVIGLNGLPPRPLGSWQSRMLGAAALDLCAVACGMLDAYVDCVDDAHGVWDIAAGVLICREAGADVRELHDRALVPLSWQARLTPIAAATAELGDVLHRVRQGF